MTRKPEVSRRERIFTIVIAVFWLVLVVIAYFGTEDTRSRIIGGLMLTSLAGLLLWSCTQDRREKTRLHRLLDGRPPLDSVTFGETYFPTIYRGPEIGAAVRTLLEEHVEVDLAGLRPDDPLDDFYDYLDPIFFDELSNKVGFRPLDNDPEFRELVAPLKTVEDLVAAVARKFEQDNK